MIFRTVDLPEPLGPEDADLGVRIEGQVEVLEDLLGAVGLVEPGHVIDELACHARVIPDRGWRVARYLGDAAWNGNGCRRSKVRS